MIGSRHVIAGSELERTVYELNWKNKQILFLNAGTFELYKVIDVIAKDHLVLAFINPTTGASESTFEFHKNKRIYLGQNSNVVFFSEFPLVGKNLIIKNLGDDREFDEYGKIISTEEGIMTTEPLYPGVKGKKFRSSVGLVALYINKFYFYTLNGNDLIFRKIQIED